MIFEDGDTRIREYDDHDHGYETFEDAREDALTYLQGLIDVCQGTFYEIEQADTFEEYNREKFGSL